MSAIFSCEICNLSFNEKRSFISHERSQRHTKKAGESFQGFTCELCGHQLSRTYDIARHQQQGGCLRVEVTPAQLAATSNKRKYHADHEVPNQRIRTTSPTRRYDLSDSALMFDTSVNKTVPPWIPEQAGARAIPTNQRLSQNADDSGTATSNPISRDAADQDSAVDTDVYTMDDVADIELGGAQRNTYLPPLADIGIARNIPTPAPASPDQQGSLGIQVSLFKADGDGFHAVGGVESLTHVFERTSMETKQRSSFALSVATGYSEASQTRSSIRSYLMNPSLGSIRRLSWYSDLSKPSSDRSLKRASTVFSEMAGTMLEPIDEELRNSRESGSRMGRYVPSVFWKNRHPKMVREDEERFLQEKIMVATDSGICREMPSQSGSIRTLAIDSNLQDLWKACERGDVVSVTRLITKLNVNPNSLNAHRRTPLSIAASHGHEALVRKLLEHDAVDVSIQDVNGATALTWAASRGHLGVVNLLLSSEPTTSRNQASRCAAWALARRNGHGSVAEVLIVN
jgi:hypothetical protein